MTGANQGFDCPPQSDPDLPPSPADEVFDTAPAPPPYLLPQPSIEEARQQMHSLLDDAFALVSPSSQGSGGLSRVSPALLQRYAELSPTSAQPPPPRSAHRPRSKVSGPSPH